jgi:hypothetical protein
MGRRPVISPGGRTRRELHSRIDALHLQREKLPDYAFNKAVEGQRHLPDDLATAPPMTLAFSVKREFFRRGRGNVVGADMSEQMRRIAMDEAKWAVTRDDNPNVCARFAVDMALNWATRSLGFDIAPPGCFVQGGLRPSYFDVLKNSWVWPMTKWPIPDDDDGGAQPDTTTPVPLMYGDLAQLTKAAQNLALARCLKVIPATWAPKTQSSIYICDMTRPPVEVLVVITRAMEALSPPRRSLSLISTPAALCIGAGWGGTAQALSALLPLHWVYHQPWPYHDLAMPPLDWEVVVLNVPARHQWLAAKVIGTPGEVPTRIHKKVMRGIGSNNGGKHVELLVKAAVSKLGPKTLLVLVADHRTYQSALGHLKTRAQVVPATFDGLDTEKQPIWVGYENRPWAPHGLPRPTARLMSFWTVAP